MVPPKFEMHCGQWSAIRDGPKHRKLSTTILTSALRKFAGVIRSVPCHFSWFRVIQTKEDSHALSELIWPSSQRSLGDRCRKTSRIFQRGAAALSPKEALTTSSSNARPL